MNNSLQSGLNSLLSAAILIGSSPIAIAQTIPAHISLQHPSNPSATITAMQPDSNNVLGETAWQLVRYRTADGTLVDAVPDRVASVEFQGDRMYGTTGCNRFFSTYTRDGATLSISVGGTTLMACIPDALAQQEAAMLSVLPQVTRYSRLDNQLILQNGDGDDLLTFIAQPSADLIDTEWTVSSFNNGRDGLVSPLAGTTMTARFSQSGRLVGTAGCNTYQAPYRLTDMALTVGATASTRRLCAQPEGVMEQEAAFLERLRTTATYTLSGNQLELKDADGTILVRLTPER